MFLQLVDSLCIEWIKSCGGDRPCPNRRRLGKARLFLPTFTECLAMLVSRSRITHLRHEVSCAIELAHRSSVTIPLSSSDNCPAAQSPSAVVVASLRCFSLTAVLGAATLRLRSFSDHPKLIPRRATHHHPHRHSIIFDSSLLIFCAQWASQSVGTSKEMNPGRKMSSGQT